MIARVLSIAGTDPTGGAGIQADLKTIDALGGYGMAVVTCLVAQNTHGVRSVHTPPVAFLREQLDGVSDDVTIDAIKIGMLGDADVTAVVHDWLDDQRAAGLSCVVVLDPVMVASSGDRLLDPAAEEAVRRLAAAHADLLTPNLAELAVLDRAGPDTPATDWDDAVAAGRRVAADARCAVLVKGGHLPGEQTPDTIVSADGTVLAQAVGPRVPTGNTHGTGCSLSTAMATLYARTGQWPVALRSAKRWLTGALRAADDLHVGTGTGPVHHGHHLTGTIDAWLEAAAEEPASSPASGRNGQIVSTGFTDELWARSASIRREIDDLDFIHRLADGSLPDARFRYYLAQDAVYLQAYSRALAALASSSAPAAVREFFARGAVETATEETALHRLWLDENPTGAARGTGTSDLVVGDVTAQYTDFLLARTGREPWQVGAAAVLPCYWLYAEIAATLIRGLRERGTSTSSWTHPYETWLRTYDDPGFQDTAAHCRRIVDEAAREADDDTREAMRTAFLRACVLERDFFAAEQP